MRRDMRSDARAIFHAALAAVDPEAAVNAALSRTGDTLALAGRIFDLRAYERIVVVGAGKAAAPMARALEKLLGDRISTGLVVVKYGHTLPLDRVSLREAGHPVPDEAGLAAAQALVDLLETCGPHDLVLSVISGGGSALLPLPPAPITLAEKQALTSRLLASGADIHALNAVRKHISRTKGGGLARAAAPATVINLMLSDVVGDDMDVIASGPFVPDATTAQDAIDILGAYGLFDTAPASIRGYLMAQAHALAPQDAGPFEKVTNLVIGSNRTACLAAQAKAVELGYKALILSTLLEGDTTACAHAHTAIAREVLASGNPLAPPACIVSGGETTVIVKGHGRGGRNQEFALVCARDIAGIAGAIVCLSGGTDGTDGPTDAAGGIVDAGTVSRGKAQGLEINTHLADNDAYHYLEATGDLLKTGPTHTNVMDIHIVLVDE